MCHEPRGEIQDRVVEHLATHFGPPHHVFTCPRDDGPPVDVLHVPPDADRRHHVLATAGMSSQPMEAPQPAHPFRFAELCLFVESSWRIDGPHHGGLSPLWPMQVLGDLAAFPFLHDTWLGHGHTVTDPEQSPVVEGLPFSAVVLLDPGPTLGADALTLRQDDGPPIWFWIVYPLFSVELKWTVELGVDVLHQTLLEREPDLVTRLRRGCLLPDPVHREPRRPTRRRRNGKKI